MAKGMLIGMWMITVTMLIDSGNWTAVAVHTIFTAICIIVLLRLESDPIIRNRRLP